MDYNIIRKNERNDGKNDVLRKIIIITSVCAASIAVIATIIVCVIINTPKNTNPPVAVEYTTPIPTELIEETALPTSEPTPEPTLEPTPTPISRRGTAEPIPQDIRSSMAGKSMPSHSTVSYEQLSYLTIPHYDFNYNVVEGHLIVNAALAEEVLDIFAELYDIKYPIERMELIDKYNADDFTSIEYNNTSAFNYRVSTSGSGNLSNHALGRAIDINPQQNPYVSSNGTGAHSNAQEYWARDISKWSSDIARAAYIGTDTEIYKIFTKYGWKWGGNWSSYRDYQHFEKKN